MWDSSLSLRCRSATGPSLYLTYLQCFRSLRSQMWLAAIRDKCGMSVSISIGTWREHRAHENLQVEPQRPVVDVVEVELNPVAHLVVAVGLAAKTVNLRPAGHTRLDVVTTRIERDPLFIVAVVRKRVGPRPDQRHVAHQNVEELRDLVDVGTTQELPDFRHPRIVARRLRDNFAVVKCAHGAKFDDAERLLVEAVAILQEKHRTRTV